ncbi:MAG: response regulator transcription factor [Syntrophales bacterium]
MIITVFLADDHAMFREGLRLLLDTNPEISVVGGAGDGRETVRQVSSLCPNIVLMDIAMPILNGIEATAQIKEACPATNIIMLSMYSTAEHIFRAFKAGAKGYLLKESAGADVIQAIMSVHAGKSYLCQSLSDTIIADYLRSREMTEAKSPLDRLSPRERAILQLLVEGRPNSKIAEILFLSPKTVETYRSHLMKKLDIKDLPGLVKFAIQHGLTSI